MLNRFRGFVSSCSLDASRKGVTGPIADAHRALAEAHPSMVQAPPGLHARVMERLADAPPITERTAIYRVPLVTAMAAALALAVGASVYFARPHLPGSQWASTMPEVPVDAGPMLRLVANTVDGPLADQTRKMYDDTRRATRAVARCIPFTP